MSDVVPVVAQAESENKNSTVAAKVIFPEWYIDIMKGLFSVIDELESDQNIPDFRKIPLSFLINRYKKSLNNLIHRLTNLN